jgi:hypothetical protein
MKALVRAILPVLLCGAASAQDSATLCRSFCDADARECRVGAHPDAWAAVDALIHLRGSATALPGEHEQAANDADKDRQARSQRCGDARQACRQKCAASAAAPAAASGPAWPAVPAASATH